MAAGDEMTGVYSIQIMRTCSFILIACLVSLGTAAAEFKPIERRIPPKGIDIPNEDRTELQEALTEFERSIQGFRTAKTKGLPQHLAPDIEVYAKAVRLALMHGEFYRKGDVKIAFELIKTGEKRLAEALKGPASWAVQRGLVMRAYRSSIDGSAQPYGLEIPEKLDTKKPSPLFVWLHGRGDKTTDMHFIRQRETRDGKIKVDNAIVLHPFGRQCMGWKSAGEIDVFDAIAHVKTQYRIDPDRIVLMGFSMGGAGAWHIGAHYPDRWVAMSAGAGFAETARYIKLKKEDYPNWYEQTLWNVYDVPSYTRNLFNLRVIAYSGENDKQIQAARVMEKSYAEHGEILQHIIGPKMGHRYDDASLKAIMAVMNEQVQRGLNRLPRKVSLQTRTLRYNRVHWVEATGLEQHWKDSRVDAGITGKNSITVTTKNVTRLNLSPEKFPIGWGYSIDGQSIIVPNYRTLTAPIPFVKEKGKWRHAVADPREHGLSKRHGMQGPIDDAFMSPFLVARPTGKSKNAKVQRWVEFELDHFLKRWRALYRGEARVKDDRDVTDQDFAQYNLVLWGDPDSNSVIRQLHKRLPIEWNNENISLPAPLEKTFASAGHVLMMIYPNPSNPNRYVVFNSGPTHREGHDRTNSLQNPKLPDWAVIDLSQTPDNLSPGKITAAGFFDEQWRIRKK